MSKKSYILPDYPLRYEKIPKLPNGDKFILDAPLRVYCSTIDEIVEIPKGFTTDGQSIPIMFRWIVPNRGDGFVGGIVHDFAYRNGGVKTPGGKFIILSFHQCNSIYYDLQLMQGVNHVQALSTFSAVESFGYLVWRKYRSAGHK